MRRMFALVVALGALAISGPVAAQHTVNIQGSAGEQKAWRDNPLMHQFYEFSKATLGKGTRGVDIAAYEKRSYEIFAAFGKSMGAPPEAMVDHLKAIPRQVVKIVEEDPATLDSYENFTVAMMGPD